jgi:uncharacterized protein YutE (UPF0331/DUF86 family)
MVDKSLVLKKLASLEQYRNQLREYSTLTVAEYRADWKIQRIVERTLQMMIELCTDVAGHLIADRELRTPENYADTFRVLGENAILTQDQTAIMEKMAKFRNIVVHQYETVDAEIVILVLQKHLDDFDLFKNLIVTSLKDGK